MAYRRARRGPNRMIRSWLNRNRRTRTHRTFTTAYKIPRIRLAMRKTGPYGLTLGNQAGSVRTPFPQNLYTVFTWSENIALSQSTPGVPALHTFRANSPYDPDMSVGPLQTNARYFRSLLGPNDGDAPYQQFRVMASKVLLKIWPVSSTANNQNCVVSLLPRTGYDRPPETVSEMRERARSKHTYLTTLGSWKPYTLKNYCKVKSLLGIKDMRDNHLTAGWYSGAPSEQVFWDLNLASIDDSGTASVTILITIVYYCQLFTKADVQDSTVAGSATYVGAMDSTFPQYIENPFEPNLPSPNP